MSLPYGHPYLEKLWKEKHKYRDIHKVIQSKKDKFLNEESKGIEKILRLDILKQIFGQIPILYKLNSDTKFILSGWKTTEEFIKNGSWKWVLFTMGSLFYGNVLVVGRSVVKPHFLKNLVKQLFW